MSSPKTTPTVIHENHHTVILEIFYLELKVIVIPNLIGDPDSFLFFFNTKRKGIYLGLCIKSRITKNTSWIPAFAGMTEELIVIPNLIGDPDFSFFYLFLRK